MAAVFLCGMECGVIAATAHHVAGTGSADFANWHYRSPGKLSLHVAPSAAAAIDVNHIAMLTAATRIFAERIYVDFNLSGAFPNADVKIIRLVSGTNEVGVMFQASDSTIRTFSVLAGAFTAGSTGVVISPATWVRLDYLLRSDANPWTADCQVNGVAVAQSTAAVIATTPTGLFVGLRAVSGVVTGEAYFDDLTASQTAGDYPLGPGRIVGYIPEADGSHNIAAAAHFRRTLTATDITNATTDAYTLIAERPLSATAGTFINLIAPTTNAEYVECNFQKATIAPKAVEAIIACHAFSTTANNLQVALRDNNGATQADIFNATIGSTTIIFKRAYFANIPGGSTWSLTAFNNLRVRCFTNDANPDPYFDAIMLEAEYGDPDDSSYPNSVLSDLPVAYWKLDDGGSTAIDSGPNGLDLTYQNAPGSVAGLTSFFNAAKSFNGTNQYANRNVAPRLQGGMAITVECWLKANQIGNRAPVGLFGSSSDKGYWLNIGSVGDGQFWISFDGSAQINGYMPAGVIPTDGRIVHFVGTYNGSTVSVYVNGVMGTTQDQAGPVHTVVNAGAVGIGELGANISDFVDGVIDDVAIYDYCMLPERVLAHFRVGCVRPLNGMTSHAQGLGAGALSRW